MAVQQTIYFEYSEIDKLVCPFEKRPFVFSYKPMRLTEDIGIAAASVCQSLNVNLVGV